MMAAKEAQCMKLTAMDALHLTHKIINSTCQNAFYPNLRYDWEYYHLVTEGIVDAISFFPDCLVKAFHVLDEQGSDLALQLKITIRQC
jgi:hypothetical protein